MGKILNLSGTGDTKAVMIFFLLQFEIAIVQWTVSLYGLIKRFCWNRFFNGKYFLFFNTLF